MNIMQRFVQLGLALMILTGLMACSATTTISVTQDAQYSYFTLSMSEEDAAEIIEGILTFGDTPLMRTATVDLLAGEIAVQGDVVTETGGTQPGTLAIRVWAQDGDLHAEVTQFQFAGFTAEQSALDAFNVQLTDGLAQAARQDNGESDLTDVTLTDTALSFTVRSPR